MRRARKTWDVKRERWPARDQREGSGSRRRETTRKTRKASVSSPYRCCRGPNIPPDHGRIRGTGPTGDRCGHPGTRCGSAPLATANGQGSHIGHAQRGLEGLNDAAQRAHGPTRTDPRSLPGFGGLGWLRPSLLRRLGQPPPYPLRDETAPAPAGIRGWEGLPLYLT